MALRSGEAVTAAGAKGVATAEREDVVLLAGWKSACVVWVEQPSSSLTEGGDEGMGMPTPPVGRLRALVGGVYCMEGLGGQLYFCEEGQCQWRGGPRDVGD